VVDLSTYPLQHDTYLFCVATVAQPPPYGP
jgi:hypothetical protein